MTTEFSLPATLNVLARDVLEINTNNGWDVTTIEDWHGSKYKIPAVIALIGSEASEALEAFRNNDYANFREEIADIIIRCLDLAAGMGMDIEYELLMKMQKNHGRGM